MSERFKGEQGKISALEGKVQKEKTEATKEKREEKTKTLREKLAAERSTYFGSVDSIKDELKTAKTSLKDTLNKQMIDNWGDDINTKLSQAATKGEEIYAAQMAGNKGAGLEQLSTYAANINWYVEQIEKGVPFFSKMEKVNEIMRKKSPDAMKKVKQIWNDKKLSVVEKQKQVLAATDSAVDILAEAKKITKTAGSPPEDYVDYLAETHKLIDTELKSLSAIKEYYAIHDFVNSEKNQQYLIFDEKTGQVKKTRAFAKLPEEEQERILLEMSYERLKIKDEIGEKTAAFPEEKGYFEAKKLLAEGKPLEAKKKLLDYWHWMNKKHWEKGTPVVLGTDQNGQVMLGVTEGSYDGKMTDEEADMHDNSEELLQQIALMEIAQARARYEALKSSLNSQWHSMGSGTNTLGLTAPQTKIYLDKTEQILKRAESMVKDEKWLTIEGVLNELKTMTPDSSDYAVRTFQGRLPKEFDVLSAQVRLNQETDPEKRRDMALAEARRAHKLGLNDVARMYYDQYFMPALEQAKKKVNRSEIAKRMRKDGDLQQRIWNEEPKMREQVKKQWREKNGGEIPEDKLDEIVYSAKEKMFQRAVSAAYNKAVKAEAHDSFQGDMSEMGKEWNSLYSNTFVNLDYHRERSWYELWKFTPEEWDGFLTQLWLDVGLLVVSMGVGNIAKTITLRAAMTQLAKQTGKKFLIEGAEQALKQGGKAYVKYIIREVGFKRAAALGLLSIGVESGATTAANIALQKVVRGQEFDFHQSMQTWGKMTLMMTVGRGINLGMAGRATGGVVKQGARYVGEGILEEGVSSGFEIALMALTGEELTNEKVRQLLRDNVVYAVGMPAGMALARKATAPEVPKITGADKKIRLKGVELELGVDFTKPASIKSAIITPEGVVIVNGKPAFTADSLGALPKKARQRIESLAGTQAKSPKAPSANLASFKEKLKDMDLPKEKRQQVEELVAKYEKAEINAKELDAAIHASFNESRKILIPDPDRPGQMMEVDLLSDYKTKNFAYSPEMTKYFNDYEKLKSDGPIIVKHGGDEIVILHAGPDGKTQMFFGDVGNMGPSNEFSLRVKGGDANLVDLYLRELSAIIKSEFVAGKDVNGPQVLDRIKNQLAKKFFGIETEAAFNTLKEKYGLEGTWDDYQRNMNNAKILAGFRSDARGLQAEFLKDYPEANSTAKPLRDNQEFADFVGTKIDGLDKGSPPLTEILRDNLDAFAESGALKDLLPEGLSGSNTDVLTKDGLEKILKKKNRTAEEQLIVYFALRRVNADDLPAISGTDITKVGKRFAAVRQNPDDVTLMDFQMAGVEVPSFKGRDFNHTDMKFFLDKVLEDALHKAKENKGSPDIEMVKSPFDESGNLSKPEDAAEYKKAAEDKKPEEVSNFLKLKEQAAAKLDQIKAQIDKISSQEKPSRADIDALLKLKGQYDRLITAMNQRKFSDPETGVDRPAKFAEHSDFWLRNQKGEKIPPERQMMREFVFDLHNTGAINAQRGYAVTDAAMSALALQLKMRFPGASAIVRSGGGQLRVYYFDSGSIPKIGGEPMTFAQHQAHMQGELAGLSKVVYETVWPNGKTSVDGIVRDATSRLRSKPSEGTAPVGEVKLTGQAEVKHKEFTEGLKAAEPPASLFKVREYRGQPEGERKPVEDQKAPEKKEAA